MYLAFFAHVRYLSAKSVVGKSFLYLRNVEINMKTARVVTGDGERETNRRFYRFRFDITVQSLF